MALNKITDATGYVKFEIYSGITSALSKTVIIPKINVTSIQAFANLEDHGVVGVFTTPQVDQHTKGNSLIELAPEEWALSTAATTPIADVATLLTNLITYFSTKW